MRRVLVPLDGTDFATRILPDAQRLAGPDGELLLVRDTGFDRYDPVTGAYIRSASDDEAQAYLQKQAEILNASGTRARAQCLNLYDISRSIDLAAQVFHADFI